VETAKANFVCGTWLKHHKHNAIHTSPSENIATYETWKHVACYYLTVMGIYAPDLPPPTLHTPLQEKGIEHRTHNVLI
jgi:hypothetical protein